MLAWYREYVLHMYVLTHRGFVDVTTLIKDSAELVGSH
jgi:hypothetical protein